MKKYLISIVLFITVGLCTGEAIARIFVLSSDMPRRTIDSHGIQKYMPDQQGYWKGRSHSWQVNRLGWPGPLPVSNDSLITIIGDSFIENFMNPDECRQASYLKKLMPRYNFMEVSRSGISLIESLEIAKYLDSLTPKKQFIYVHDTDFEESILQIKKRADITQIDLDNNTIVPGRMRSPVLKRILYNWKFFYFLYNQYLVKHELLGNTKKDIKIAIAKPKYPSEFYNRMLSYIRNNYNIENIVLVFRPSSTYRTIKLAENFGFKTISLDTKKDQNWTFEFDWHWSCYGHEQAAKQVHKNYLTLFKTIHSNTLINLIF